MSRLSSDDWQALTEIARRAISSVVLENRVPDFSPFPPALSERRGAFVSLYRCGALRGCVGQVENPGAVADVVARSAISAALFDSRFAPISAEELTSLEIEISVLTAPERIALEAIVAGRHGLMVVHGSFRGLLLPQVATERNWSGQRLLEETCVKAGLARDAWRDPATEVYGFTAEIFSEKGMRKTAET
ncbi:MAG TPA: AmmeMemoRadiSam system protein A [Candidatus Acidoferrales bacterium]|jgi:AmmeMemoRadiSam system protein A|nr:AmmeMemoRadiSam system protein A [Candidatus Acidoferrales bacterium]